MLRPDFIIILFLRLETVSVDLLNKFYEESPNVVKHDIINGIYNLLVSTDDETRITTLQFLHAQWDKGTRGELFSDERLFNRIQDVRYEVRNLAFLLCSKINPISALANLEDFDIEEQFISTRQLDTLLKYADSEEALGVFTKILQRRKRILDYKASTE